jgi:hypothetical protein
MNVREDGEMRPLLARVRRIDPLYAVLYQWFKSPVHAGLITGLVHVVAWILVSTIVRAKYQQPGGRVYSGFPDELVGWYVWAIAVPVIWIYYRWLPEGLFTVIERLCYNQVIDGSALDENARLDDASDPKDFSLAARLATVLGHARWTWLSLGVAITTVIAQYWMVRPTEMASGLFPAWYAAWWSVAILEANTFINAYVCVQFAIRAITSATELRRFFQSSELAEVFLVHPDGGGGLGELGRFAMRLALFSVMLGFWAVGITLAPVFVGGRPNFSMPVLAVYVLYVVLVPFTLLVTVWPVHRAMKRFKEHRLRILSLEIQELLDSLLEPVTIEPRETGRAFVKLKKLKELYSLAEEIPEWPTTPIDLSRFGGVALLPAATGLVSFIIDVVHSIP